MKRIAAIALLAVLFILAFASTVFADGDIYWIDGATTDIEKIALNGTGHSIVIPSRSTQPMQIAVDPAAGYIFWTEPYTSGGSILRADTDGSNVTPIFSNLGQSPQIVGIDCDPATSTLYWYGGTSAAVYKGAYSGGSATLVYSFANVVDLAVDSAHSKIYVIGSDLSGPVYRVGTDGSGYALVGRHTGYAGNGVEIEVDPYDETVYCLLDNSVLYHMPGGGGDYAQVGILSGPAGLMSLNPHDDVVYYKRYSLHPMRSIGTDGTGDTALGYNVDSLRWMDYAPDPVITVSDVSAAEGDSGSTLVAITATLSRANDGVGATVQYATAAGTATANQDFQLMGGSTFYWAPGETVATAEVTVYGDELYEGNETFYVNLSNDNNCAIGTDQATITILDDEDPPTLSVSDGQVVEGNSLSTTMRYTVTQSSTSATPVTMTVSTADGTATAPGDYQAIAGQQLIIPALATERYVDVTVAGDTMYETDETVLVSLSGVQGATVVDGQGEGTIRNDDIQPSVSLSDAMLAESDTGSANMAFTATLSNASYQAVDLQLSTADGTATAGADYAALSSQALQIPAGSTQATQDVAVLGDTGYEGNETFTLNVVGQTGCTVNDGSGTGTIIENDPAPTISVDSPTVSEGDSGTTDMVFTVSVSPAPAIPVTGNASTADGAATTADSDYVAITSQHFEIPAGETSTTITVTVNGDVRDEFNETLDLNLTSILGALPTSTSGTGTITNDDSGYAPTISISDGWVTEGNAMDAPMTFTVTLSAASGKPVTVTYGTDGTGTATPGTDYTAVASDTATFAPGSTSRLVYVNAAGDTTDEPDETFGVQLSSPENGTLSDADGVGTIQDNDPAPTINVGDATAVTEGNSGSTNAQFSVTLSEASAKTVTATLSTADGTAIAGADYTAVSDHTVTFNAGETTKTVDVPVLGDVLDEENESFTLTIDSTDATLGDGTGAATITDDDGPPTVSISDASATEGDSGTASMVFTVTLSAVSGQTVAVEASTQDGSAMTADGDYVAFSNQSVLFAAGETTQFVTATVNGDTTYEAEENFDAVLGSPTNCTIADGTGTGTILNDDAQPTLSISDAQVAEGDLSTTTMTFTVSLSNASDQTVSFGAQADDNTATASVDYAGMPLGVLTVQPGILTKDIGITVYGDIVAEGAETFTMTLSSPMNATIADGAGIGTILDDDSEIVVLGNGIEILDGDTMPTALNDTDFCGVGLNGSAVTHTFTISNASAVALDLTGIPAVQVLGPNAGDFAVTQPTTDTVAASSAITFDVTFDPSVMGEITGTISIPNSDGNEDPYNFAIVGKGTLPCLDVQKNLYAYDPTVGELITYTIVIQNLGDDTASGMTVSDTLPASMAFAGPVTMAGATGTLAQSGLDMPDLARGFSIAPQGSVTISLPVTVVGATEDITNTVVVTCDEVVTPTEDSHLVGFTRHATSYVDGSLGTDAVGYGHGPGADAYKTIQEAIDHTEDGGMIRVAAGTYREHVVLGSHFLVGGADDDVPDSQVILDGGGSGAVVTIPDGFGYLSGLTIQNGDIGVLVASPIPGAGLGSSATGSPGLSLRNAWVHIHFCNIVDHNQYGIMNDAFTMASLFPDHDTCDATDNWWGASDGPSGVGPGSGSAVSANVLYDPWTGARVAASTFGYLWSDETTVDAVDETGVILTKDGPGTPFITISRYDGNPCGPSDDAVGLFWDVQVENQAYVASITLNFYLSAAELGSYVAESLDMQWWNGTAWVSCSNQTIVPGEVVRHGITFAAYIEVVIDDATSPTLAQLTGTEFALTGLEAAPPSSIERSLTVGPDPFCPGWNLDYTLVVTNTSVLTMEDMTTTDPLPDGVSWLGDLPGSDAAGDYDAGTNTVTWLLGDMGPNDVATLRYQLHTFSSLADGSTLTNTMWYSSTNLTEAGSAAVGSLVDTGICGTQPTPEPSPTPEPQVGASVWLPLIMN